MNNNKNYSREKGRYKLIEALHNCGIISVKMFQLMCRDGNYLRKPLSRLIKEGRIRKESVKGGESFYVLNDYDKYIEEYKNNFPKGYTEKYKSIIQPLTWMAISKNGKKENKNIKEIRDAEILLLMHEAGIKSYFDEKPNIYSDFDIYLNEEEILPVYFSGTEIKRRIEHTDDVNITALDKKKNIGYTRIIGVLIGKSNYYAVYNFGNHLINWAVNGEYKVLINFSAFFREHDFEISSIQRAIIFTGKSLDPFLGLVSEDFKKKNTGYTFKLDQIDILFKATYILPYTEDGLIHLNLMAQSEWFYKLKKAFLKNNADKTVQENYLTVECDGYDKENNIYIFIFCAPDIVRYKKFCLAAKYRENKDSFRVYCFEYQTDFVQKTIGGYSQIYSIPIKKYSELQREEDLENGN